MVDVTGKEIKIGDMVVTNKYGYTDTLYLGFVTRFTNQKVEVSSIGLKFGRQVAIVEKS